MMNLFFSIFKLKIGLLSDSGPHTVLYEIIKDLSILVIDIINVILRLLKFLFVFRNVESWRYSTAIADSSR